MSPTRYLFVGVLYPRHDLLQALQYNMELFIVEVLGIFLLCLSGHGMVFRIRKRIIQGWRMTVRQVVDVEACFRDETAVDDDS